MSVGVAWFPDYGHIVAGIFFFIVIWTLQTLFTFILSEQFFWNKIIGVLNVKKNISNVKRLYKPTLQKLEHLCKLVCVCLVSHVVIVLIGHPCIKYGSLIDLNCWSFYQISNIVLFKSHLFFSTF